MRAADREYSYTFLAGCTKPKLFLSGMEDEFGPVAAVQAALSAVPEPKRLTWISGAEHFFVGRLPEMQAALTEWVREAVL